MPSSARSESVRASARPRLRRTRLTTAALAVILAAAGPAEAGSPASAAAENAATARTASTAATAVNHAADDTAASSYDLTLVTGDTVPHPDVAARMGRSEPAGKASETECA